MATINDIIQYFETRYPMYIRDLAYDENNTGLLYGERDTDLTSAVISLECSLETIHFAISQGANLIICHHTPFFRPITTYDMNDYRVKVLSLLMEHQIAVYCSHTALDRAEASVNVSGLMAKQFKLAHIRSFITDADGYGLGAIGEIDGESHSFLQLLEEKVGRLRTNMKISGLKTVAILGGSGESYWKEAQRQGCDALLTGDVTFHTAQDAKRENFLLIDISHESERFAMEEVSAWLCEKFSVVFFEENERIFQ